MSAEAIDINVEIVESCISELVKLSLAIEGSTKSDFEVVGAGYTSSYMKTINNNFLVLTNSLHFMVNNTMKFLVQAKEGYVNSDEDRAEALRTLQ
ncbi:hypothetical protein [Clostridium polynesiense]|uniref:hypothetical protein n=1 Tax=Clostridium polynesiense TaxID=1325933 RepID=UPI00058D5BCC|nr:hypothetical protein [Clostridium polynesiense]